jgi:hypothetical protein
MSDNSDDDDLPVEEMDKMVLVKDSDTTADDNNFLINQPTNAFEDKPNNVINLEKPKAKSPETANNILIDAPPPPEQADFEIEGDNDSETVEKPDIIKEISNCVEKLESIKLINVSIIGNCNIKYTVQTALTYSKNNKWLLGLNPCFDVVCGDDSALQKSVEKIISIFEKKNQIDEKIKNISESIRRIELENTSKLEKKNKIVSKIVLYENISEILNKNPFLKEDTDVQKLKEQSDILNKSNIEYGTQIVEYETTHKTVTENINKSKDVFNHINTLYTNIFGIDFKNAYDNTKKNANANVQNFVSTIPDLLTNLKNRCPGDNNSNTQENSTSISDYLDNYLYPLLFKDYEDCLNKFDVYIKANPLIIQDDEFGELTKNEGEFNSVFINVFCKTIEHSKYNDIYANVNDKLKKITENTDDSSNMDKINYIYDEMKKWVGYKQELLKIQNKDAVSENMNKYITDFKSYFKIKELPCNVNKVEIFNNYNLLFNKLIETSLELCINQIGIYIEEFETNTGSYIAKYGNDTIFKYVSVYKDFQFEEIGLCYFVYLHLMKQADSFEQNKSDELNKKIIDFWSQIYALQELQFGSLEKDTIPKSNEITEFWSAVVSSLLNYKKYTLINPSDPTQFSKFSVKTSGAEQYNDNMYFYESLQQWCQSSAAQDEINSFKTQIPLLKYMFSFLILFDDNSKEYFKCKQLKQNGSVIKTDPNLVTALSLEKTVKNNLLEQFNLLNNNYNLFFDYKSGYKEIKENESVKDVIEKIIKNTLVLLNNLKGDFADFVKQIYPNDELNPKTLDTEEKITLKDTNRSATISATTIFDKLNEIQKESLNNNQETAVPAAAPAATLPEEAVAPVELEAPVAVSPVAPAAAPAAPAAPVEEEEAVSEASTLQSAAEDANQQQATDTNPNSLDNIFESIKLRDIDINSKKNVSEPNKVDAEVEGEAEDKVEAKVAALPPEEDTVNNTPPITDNNADVNDDKNLQENTINQALMEATAITGGNSGGSRRGGGVAKIMGEELTREKNNNSAQTPQPFDNQNNIGLPKPPPLVQTTTMPSNEPKPNETPMSPQFLPPMPPPQDEPIKKLSVAPSTVSQTIKPPEKQEEPTPAAPLTPTEIDIFLKLINIPQGYFFDKIKNIPGKGLLVILIILIYILIIYFCSFFWIANKENRNVVAMESKMFRNLVYNRSGDDVIKNIKNDAFQNIDNVEPMTNHTENPIQTKINTLFSIGKKKVGDFLQYSEKKIEVGIEGFIEWVRRLMVQSAIREQKIKTTRRL